jgi:hypothetical protein
LYVVLSVAASWNPKNKGEVSAAAATCADTKGGIK